MITPSTPPTLELVSTDPYTGETVGAVAMTPVEDIARVVATAREAGDAWAARPLADRVAVLKSARSHLEAAALPLGEMITREQGKPIKHGRGEAAMIGAGLEAELDRIAAALEPEVLEDDNTRSVMHFDALGVCVAITPWNFPVLMPHWLVLPALAAGNSVVLKPSELTPLCGQMYADALNQVLPPGVLQVVHGKDEQGKALVAGEVDLIAFTGSRDAGRHIMHAASTGLKRLILELGSKDPLIVLEDADAEKAAEFAAMNSFRNSGQVCVSTERVYVHEKIADVFMDHLLEKTRDFQVGHGMDERTTMGPMVDARQKAHVLAQIEDAKAKGARVLAGGESGEGNLLAPTVLLGVSHDMDICTVETFGPVAAVRIVKDDAEALELANDSDLGLGGVVFGEQGHASRIARQIKAGMIGVNKGIGGATGTPWVGARQSGYGYHGSREGHRQFCQVRVVSEAKTPA
ncbi:MAG: aldehyde dehydrogenase family protein [Phycisphaerales bacterium JB063]